MAFTISTLYQYIRTSWSDECCISLSVGPQLKRQPTNPFEHGGNVANISPQGRSCTSWEQGGFDTSYY